MRINEKFLESICTREPVAGFTHNFYRYPARFSPLFAREAILKFTKPGALVLDPFMGGGTTLVEAQALGRAAIGTDINSLAIFVAEAKTTIMSEADLASIEVWATELLYGLSLRSLPIRADQWVKLGYQRNVSTRNTWQIRKTLELALAGVEKLNTSQQKRFARCVLLRTAQWALDCRSEFPSAKQFRRQFRIFLEGMISGAKAYAATVASSRKSELSCLHRSVIGIESEKIWARLGAPSLILTSPPYPGVHVLYHRWQVRGRRETPAPFWISGSMDGSGASFYTMGDRQQQNLSNYYEQIYSGFVSLAKVADRKTTVVQLVAFSDPSWQLAKYLEAMNRAGFSELRPSGLASTPDGRLWRSVPNRKWYATKKGTIGSSSEVVLFHKLRNR